MKRIAVLTFAALFAACNQSESKLAPPSFKVGLLTPGSVNDHGWNAIAYEGLQKIHTQLGAEISNQETKTPA